MKEGEVAASKEVQMIPWGGGGRAWIVQNNIIESAGCCKYVNGWMRLPPYSTQLPTPANFWAKTGVHHQKDM